MITESKAIEIAAGIYPSFSRPPTVTLKNDGKRTAYAVCFKDSDGKPDTTIYVNAESGEILEEVQHNFVLYDREEILAEKQERENEVRAKIRYLAQQGSRLEAMKLWRQVFGGTLEEAKSAIESIE